MPKMKTKFKITNGIIILLIGCFHIFCTFLPVLYSKQFSNFSKFYFFNIDMGFESFAAFWFFYFGIALVIIGLVVHLLEKAIRILPKSFIYSYFVFVIIGCYMVPLSGMTYFMLPHSLYMIIHHYVKTKKEMS